MAYYQLAKSETFSKNWVNTLNSLKIQQQNCFSPQNSNLYAYAANNPVHYIDPDGKSPYEAELRASDYKERSWFSKNIDEPITKFLARNIFGFSPSDYVKLLDGTIVPMSENGISFSNTEKTIDVTFFCITAFFAVFDFAQASNIVSKSTEVSSTTKTIASYKSWPDDGGFLGGFYKTETAEPGQVFSRIGDLNGKYTAPPGTTLNQRGLPSSYFNTKETLWKVEKPFTYKGGIAAPWQDASGGGIQYELPDTIYNLWKNGFISPVE